MKYEKYWNGFLHGWSRNVLWDVPCYFGTDIEFDSEDHNFEDFKLLYSGPGEWSDRLINLLNHIPTDYLFYIQEDMWPNAYPPDLEKLMFLVQEKDLYRLQISPIVQFYSLSGTNPIYFHWKSKYLVSHQPSIWRKDFLLSCLKPNEDPWANEYRGTQRLNNESITGKIAIYPHNWFSHESVKLRK